MIQEIYEMTSPIQQLLSFAALLKPQKKSDESLSLKQLIPVHDSLIQSLLGIANSEKVHLQEASNTIRDIVKALAQSEEEATLILDILKSKKNADILLAIQYLLAIVPNCLFFKLQNITFSILEENTQYDALLRDAILHASFAKVSGYEEQDLKTCLESIHVKTCNALVTPLPSRSKSKKMGLSFADINIIIHVSCKIMTRLLTTELSSDAKDVVLTYIFQTIMSILNAICYYNLDQPLIANGKTTILMKPITALLLPALLENQNGELQSRMDHLWLFICDLIGNGSSEKRKCRTWEKAAPSVASALLCILAGSIHDLTLTIPESYRDSIETSATLSEMRIFWEFLQTCLSSGSDDNSKMDSTKGMRGGGGFTQTKKQKNPYQDGTVEDTDVDQMVRRRGIHILSCVMEAETRKCKSALKNDISNDEQQMWKAYNNRINLWKKYVMVFEALEMEVEVHLVEQVWGTTLELCRTCVDSKKVNLKQDSLPQMTWEWVGSLFSRVLMSDSPTLRKLALFRMTRGEVGFKATHDADETMTTATNKLEAAPISIISPRFMLFDFIRSYDSLVTVGTGVNFEVDGKASNFDLATLLPTFVSNYTQSLFGDARLQEFIESLLSKQFLDATRPRTLVSVFDAIVEAWDGQEGVKVNLTVESISSAVLSLQDINESGSVVLAYRQSLMLAFARILSLSNLAENKKPVPIFLLNTLSLFPAPEETTELTTFHKESDASLHKWLFSFGESWIVTVAAACASGFLSGDLLEYSNRFDNGLVFTSKLERQFGGSVAKLCALVGNNESPSSSLLWPSINKGLQACTSFGGGSSIPFSKEIGQKIARAIILLELGCRERKLGGVGNGDLVLDKDGNMLPVPPSIDLLLSKSINFILEQLKMVSVCNYDEANAVEDTVGGRSTKSQEFSKHFIILIKQLMVLKNSFPSSIIMSQSLNGLLSESLNSFHSKNNLLKDSNVFTVKDAMLMMKTISMIYAILTVGADLETNTNSEEKVEIYSIVEKCSSVLDFKFKKPTDKSKIATWQVKGMTSLFEHSRWGALMFLVPLVYKTSSEPLLVMRQFHDTVIGKAIDSVNATPADALPCLFEAAVFSAKESFDMFTEDEKQNTYIFSKNVRRIIDTFFAVMKDTTKSPVRNYMLNVTCSIIFQPRLLVDEYKSLARMKSKGDQPNLKLDAPVLTAFRKLMKEAGTSKPHMSKFIMSYIAVGWLGDQSDKENVGIAAIPYRGDIAKLFTHKEEVVEKSAAHQEGLVKKYEEGDFTSLPEGVPQSSMVRGFLAIFFSNLPDADTINKDVLTKLCHYLISYLLNNICLFTERIGSTLLTTGSVEYVQKIRAWQALCMLHRYVTPDIADETLRKVFAAMDQQLHGQIRYWVEVFTIQVARKNPNVFINIYKDEILRTDLSTQQVSSLMIMGGNLMVGHYSALFLKQIMENNASILRDVIAGTIPWLSSTQGFCRAIAQLLTHKLIPLTQGTSMQGDDTFFLKTISKFLETNKEMVRLRKKQSKFFEQYDVDFACSPEGMFSYPLDNGDESNPPHLVEIMRKCLVDVYEDTSPLDAPEWKQLEDEIAAFNEKKETSSNTEDSIQDDSELVNFQRKILPVDTLNLSLQEHAEASLRNAAGRTRQSLIVCASLIDKVTNLAGLTRTAEIFAAEKIVVPDKKVSKMDNFKSIAVGAEDWVDIEECKEADLLQWLKDRKEDGYSIIGIEQTSSSQCLSNIEFEEKSVLLLGKEKEGIPVEFLQMVDKCVEIPQLGIIRSLNVHVSGAISIWEFTKQMMNKRARLS